jgi:hypothetical protein
MKNIALMMVVSLVALSVFAADKKDRPTLLEESTQTASKKEVAGAFCGKENRGVIMFGSNGTKYCCLAYDINKTGDKYSVNCVPQ